MKTFVTLLLLLGLVSCASSPTKYYYSESCHFPEELYFRWSTFPDTTEYRISQLGTISKTQSFGDRSKTEVRRIPEQSWKQLEAFLTLAKVANWKPIYKPEQTIYDGYGWSFRLKSKDLMIVSGGDNAGPAPSDTSKSLSSRDSVSTDHLLLATIEDVWQQSKK